MTKTVAVWGASGRLGQVICSVIEDMPGFELTQKLGSANSPDADKEVDLVVDATSFEASKDIVLRALGRGQKVLLGTSGWDDQSLEELHEVVAKNSGAAVLHVPNFSLGSVMQEHLAKIAAPFYDSIEIIEMHHDKKIDSPSGTAVSTAKAIEKARNSVPVAAPNNEQAARGQAVSGVPVHSLRLKGVLAKQQVIFGGEGETLTVVHETQSADAYKKGIEVSLKALAEMSGFKSGLASLLGV